MATRTLSNRSAWARSIAFCVMWTLSARLGAMLTAPDDPDVLLDAVSAYGLPVGDAFQFVLGL